MGTVLGLIVVGFAGWALNGKAETGSSSVAADEPVASAEPAPSGGGLAQVPPSADAGGPTVPAGPGNAPGGGPVPQRPSATGNAAVPGKTEGASPSPSRAAVAPSASGSSPAAPSGTRLTSPGGVVYASCGSGKVTLSSWDPADGYAVEKVQPGPSLTTVIVFRSAPSRYRMTVTCVAGTPTPVVLPL